MRGLVYIFVGLVAVGIAATAYLGLTFTPIEALLAGVSALAIALIVLQRSLFLHDMQRLEKSIQDLSRLLSTDAKAGQNLTRRLNELANIEPERRLEVLEADVSVLGTVVRQLAESMAEMEEKQLRGSGGAAGTSDAKDASTAPQSMPAEPEEGPVIPLEMLRQALGEDRLVHYIEPIITLPQRRPHGFDLLPRLLLEDGDIAETADFMPRSGGMDVIAEIETVGLLDAITLARRSLTAGEPVVIYAHLSRSTLAIPREKERILALLDANRAVAEHLGVIMPEQDFTEAADNSLKALEEITGKGVGISLSETRSLRLNYGQLFERGVRSVRADTVRFIDHPASYTDFHTADIAAYVGRFDVELIMTGVRTEQHVLTLLDDGIGLAKGPHLGEPGPIRSEFSKTSAIYSPATAAKG